MTMANPFYYDVPAKPGDFVGREILVRRISDNLCSNESRSHGVVGGRRFGKSSVLNAIYRELETRLIAAQADDLHVIPINISLHRVTQPVAANVVLGFLLHSVRDATHGRRLPPPFSSGPIIELGLPEYKNGPESCDFDNLENGLIELIATAYQHIGNLRVVLLIDEIETALDRPWTASLFGNMRSLIYDSKVKDFVRIVVAGSGRFLGASEKGSPLLNVLEKWQLEPLDRAAIRLIVLKAEGLSDAAADEIVNQSGGHPFIAQYLLYHLCNSDLESVTPDVVQSVVNRFCDVDRLEDLRLWWSIGLGEHGRLAYLALSSTPSNEWMSIADVRNQIGLPDFEPARGLQSLVYHGFATHNGRGKYQITGELFRTWAKTTCESIRRELRAAHFAPSVTTGGGAAILGAATIGRDMIGRDYIINNYYAAGGIAETAIQTDLAKATKLRPILDILTSRYSLEEFRVLCFDVGVNFDLLTGEGFKAKAMDLVLALDRGSELEVLIDAIRRTRPDVM
jgi:Effector-associated domain 7